MWTQIHIYIHIFTYIHVIAVYTYISCIYTCMYVYIHIMYIYDIHISATKEKRQETMNLRERHVGRGTQEGLKRRKGKGK